MGPPGPAGEQGAQGPVGPQGASGDSGAPGLTLVSTRTCIGNQTKSPAGYYTTPSHTVYHFSDGSVLATCAIDDYYTTTTSSVAMYRVGQDGAQTGACDVLYDVGTNGVPGHWRFVQTATTATVTYTDAADLAPGPTTFSLACTTY